MSGAMDFMDERAQPAADRSLLSEHNNTRQPLTPQVTSQKGWDPIPYNLFAYFAAAGSMCLAFNLQELPKLPFPVIGNLLEPAGMTQVPEAASDASYVNPAMGLMVLWMLHFVRRFAEVLYIHVYKRNMSPVECIGVIIYYTFWGFWNGWAINFHLEYFPPSGGLFALGVLLFIAGEIGNTLSHIKLKLLRSKSICTIEAVELPDPENSTTNHGHILPQGFLFRFVSCPHYLFEIITWLGFMLASFTMAAILYLLATAVTVSFYAYKRHKEYKMEFNGKDGMEQYPPKRKAIFPCIF